jgi:hypothetical protein
MLKVSAANLGTLKEHAQAIGALCISFAALEGNINLLIAVLSGLRDDNLRAFTSQMDLLKKLPTVKALAWPRKPNQTWFDDLDLFIWAIDKHIIPRRNDFIHGAWQLGQPPLRVRERIRLAKSQSRQPLTLKTVHVTPHEPNEIWTAVGDCEHIRICLGLVENELTDFDRTKRFEPLLLPAFRDHWLARRKPPTEVDGAP